MLSRCLSNFKRNRKMFKQVFVLSVLSLVWYYNLFAFYICLLALLCAYTASGGWKTFLMLYNTFPRDARYSFYFIFI